MMCMIYMIDKIEIIYIVVCPMCALLGASTLVTHGLDMSYTILSYLYRDLSDVCTIGSPPLL